MADSKPETPKDDQEIAPDAKELPTDETPTEPEAETLTEEIPETSDEGSEAEVEEVEEAETVEEILAAEDAEDAADEAAEDADEPVEEVTEEEAAVVPEPAPVQTPAEPQRRSGGVFLPLLGGVLAAGIGFGGALYLLPNGWKSGDQTEALSKAMADQDKRLSTLTESLQKLTDTVAAQNPSDEIAAALAKTEAALGGRFDQLGSDVDGLGGRLDGIDARLTEVEKRPITAAPDASGAIAAYERELENMRKELESQRGQNDEMAASVAAVADNAKAEIEAAAAKAKELETRAAVMQLRAALDSGASFATALAQLGADVPDALSAVAESGVATMAQLKADFPDAARAGLSAALRETTGDAATDRLGNFLRSQLGVRSLSPREGDDPDAVLSRAEAAVAEGRLADALTELAALPEGGQSAMADWTGAAQARLDAVAAADALAAELNVN